MGPIDERGLYDQEIFDEEKKKKFLRTLSEMYKSIAMVCNVTQMNFNDAVDAMNAEIERQSNVHNPSNQNQSSTNNQPQPFFNSFGNKSSGRARGSGNFRGRFNSQRGGRETNRNAYANNSQYHYCGKTGNFIKHCPLGMSEEKNGRITKPNYQQHSRSNGNNQATAVT